MRELKLVVDVDIGVDLFRRTPPGVRELKQIEEAWQKSRVCRTPPGVRELKPVLYEPYLAERCSRTPPGVRELKRDLSTTTARSGLVAPLPGCVN